MRLIAYYAASAANSAWRLGSITRSAPLVGRGASLPPRVALVASEHNQMSWPRGDHTPQARDAVPSGRVARASASPDP